MQPAPAQSPVEGYDRVAASRALAGLAFPGLFSSRGGAVDAAFLGGPRRISYRATPLAPAPGSHLTSAQQGYLTSYMRPCPAGLVTSATHRVTWNDSDGIPNIAHAGPSSLGAVVPIVARETTLALWRDLAANDASRPRSRGSAATPAGPWRRRPPTGSRSRSSGSASRPRRGPSSSTPISPIRRLIAARRSSWHRRLGLLACGTRTQAVRLAFPRSSAATRSTSSDRSLVSSTRTASPCSPGTEAAARRSQRERKSRTRVLEATMRGPWRDSQRQTCPAPSRKGPGRTRPPSRPPAAAR